MSKQSITMYTTDQIINVYVYRQQGKTYAEIEKVTGINKAIVPSILSTLDSYFKGNAPVIAKNPAYREALHKLSENSVEEKANEKGLDPESLISEIENVFLKLQDLVEELVSVSTTEKTKEFQEELKNLREYKEKTEPELAELRELKKVAQETNEKSFGSRLRKGFLNKNK